jgi:UDP-N-acetyl-D-mannosaminuronic acid dehydrogenase
MKVCLIGLGYVGLTLSLTLADCGVKIFGVDSNKNTIQQLKNNKSTLSEKDVSRLLDLHLNHNFYPSELIPDEDFDYFIIGVGTPLNENKLPIMDHIISATEGIAKKIKKGQTVILRSTVPVGTTRDIVIPILEKETNLKAGFDFDVVFAPERTVEGIAVSELSSNPQIIGSLRKEGIDKAKQLFLKMTPTIIEVSNIETAEMIKLIDNSYRDVCFAYSNEIALICEMLKIDARECIEKANYKYDRNNIPTPSPGVGGPCLSKDPHILSYVAKKLEYKTKMIDGGRIVNEFIPYHLGLKVIKKINAVKKENAEIKIFVIGFAFKGYPETDDIRDSPTLTIVKELKKQFKNIVGYDPIVSNNEIEKLGVSVTDLENGFLNADCVIIVNNHKSYQTMNIDNLLKTSKKNCIFVDCWALFDKLKSNPNIKYTGVGIE